LKGDYSSGPRLKIDIASREFDNGRSEQSLLFFVFVLQSFLIQK